MARRGVFCVFFTNTCSTTRRCPVRVTYIARAMPSRPVMRISHSFPSNGRTCGIPTRCGPNSASISAMCRKRARISGGSPNNSASASGISSTCHVISLSLFCYVCTLLAGRLQSLLVLLRREVDAGLLENPRLQLVVPHAQQVERAHVVVTFSDGGRLVTHDLRLDARRDFRPFGQA